MSSSGSSSGDARRRPLVESHLGLVRPIARRYAGRGEPLEDLVQVGAVGLIKASDHFDPSRGVAFATFAAPAIEGAIRDHLRDRASLLQRKSGELHQPTDELEPGLGRSPTVSELASATGSNESDVERVLSTERSKEPLPLSPGEGGVEFPDDCQTLAGSDDRLLLAGSLRALDERERSVVLLHFRADMPEREIARKIGISQAQVSRLLAGALAKLRRDLSTTGDQATPPDIRRERQSPLSAGTRPGEEWRDHARGGSSRPQRTRGETGIEPVAASEESGTRKQGETSVPAPGPSKENAAPSHNGRFLVRMPSELHEQLARAAERQEVSLNRFVTDALAATIWPRPPSAESAQPPTKPVVQTADDLPREPPLASASVEPAQGQRRSSRVSSEQHERVGTQRHPARALRVALATNLLIVVLAGLAAALLLVMALQRGI